MQNCKICCLYSGSKGNATYISAGGANILIDAGRSAKALCSALCSIGVDISSIDAIFVTHEHTDHISALRTLSHKHAIPIHMLLNSGLVFKGLCDEKLCNNLVLYEGKEFETKIKNLRIMAFQTPHDSLGAVGYRFTFKSLSGEDISVAYATDTGCVTENMRKHLGGCFATVIESNHDIQMLKSGPYPLDLKRRIASNKGHLSNADCAALACELYKSGTRNFLLAHLSEENNIPSLAYNEVFNAISDDTVNIKVAAPNEAVWLIK